MKKYKIVIVSDTHMQHGQAGGPLDSSKMPDGDLLIHCGDWGYKGDLYELVNFSEWLNELKYKYRLIVVTSGNHDFIFESENAKARGIIGAVPNVVYLQDESYQYETLKFYASPWTPAFSNWHFMKDRAELKEVWDKIPTDTNVLISHGPPLGIFDVVGRKNVGDEELRIAVDRIKPKLHCFGHVHECGPNVGEFKGTTFVNAAMAGFGRKKPVVVEISA
jgi:Icc-related predicted phosphoesterase